MRRAHHFFSWTLPLHRHVGQPHRMNHRPGIPLVVGVPLVRMAHPTARPQVSCCFCRCAAPLGPWSLSVYTPAGQRTPIESSKYEWLVGVGCAVRTMFLPGRCRHRHVGQLHRMNHRPGIPLVVGVAWCARRTLDRSTAGIMFIISVRYAPGPVVVICLHPGGPAHDD